ncbi:MAG: LysM peptidoglycan-binding domain-containing protein, partial [Bacteroidaceae bacterium]|nr:LysM peptidoglycan-binding domain-containing protein [Bacteroidaceae bacterium]
MATKAQQRHEVKSGETLYSLSRTYGVTVKQIIAANPGMSENIMAGQIIQIPVTKSVSLNQLTQSATRPLEAAVNISSKSEQSKPTVPCKSTYKVKKKETLYGIAHENGISVQELIEANPTLAKDDKL